MGYSFLCLVLTFALSCLLVCLQHASPALDDGFRGNASGNCQDYDYKPAWIARYDEGMITGLGLFTQGGVLTGGVKA